MAEADLNSTHTFRAREAEHPRESPVVRFGTDWLLKSEGVVKMANEQLSLLPAPKWLGELRFGVVGQGTSANRRSQGGYWAEALIIGAKPAF